MSKCLELKTSQNLGWIWRFWVLSIWRNGHGSGSRFCRKPVSCTPAPSFENRSSAPQESHPPVDLEGTQQLQFSGFPARHGGVPLYRILWFMAKSCKIPIYGGYWMIKIGATPMTIGGHPPLGCSLLGCWDRQTDVMVSTGLALGIGTHAGMVEAMDGMDEHWGDVGYVGYVAHASYFGSAVFWCWLNSLKWVDDSAWFLVVKSC